MLSKMCAPWVASRYRTRSALIFSSVAVTAASRNIGGNSTAWAAPREAGTRYQAVKASGGSWRASTSWA
jgi:hypothetical protein